MQILLAVNQAEALRRGINAPASTVKLEVDPSQLTETERQVLAAVLIDGHDATLLGIQSEPEEIVGQGYHPSRTTYSNGCPTRPLVLIEPSTAGLREAIAVVLAERQARRDKQVADREALRVKTRTEVMADLRRAVRYSGPVDWLGADVVEAVAATRAEMDREHAHYVATGESAGLCKVNCVVYPDGRRTVIDNYYSGSALNGDGVPTSGGAQVAVTVPYVEGVGQDQRKTGEVVRDRLALQAAAPELARRLALYQDRQAMSKRAAEGLAAQLEAAAERIGGTLLERWDGDYATEQEVKDIIANEERAARGVTLTGAAEDWGCDDSDAYAGPLSDEQFLELESFRAKLPKDAVITLWQMHDHTTNDEGEKTDDTEEGSEYIVAQGAWTVGYVTVKADTRL